MHEAALVVEGGPDSGATIPLPSGTTTLGRQTDNHVVVDDAVASSSYRSGHREARRGRSTDQKA